MVHSNGLRFTISVLILMLFASTVLMPVKAENNTILFIGDGATAGEHATSEDNTFARVVAASMQMQLIRAEASTLAEAKSAWLALQFSEPTIVVLQIGAMDAFGNSIDDSRWDTEYANLVSEMQSSGARVVVCTLFFGGVTVASELHTDYQFVNRTVRSVAFHQDALLADVWQATKNCGGCVSGTDNPSAFPPYIGDNFYPSNAGHRVIADVVLGALQGEIYLPFVANGD